MPIKGTMGVADNHAMTKRLRSTKFPDNFATRVNLSKVNIPVLSQWVEEKVNSILGFEDEIVSSTAINLFLPTASEDAPQPSVDPRRAQLDLAGFLGEAGAAEFAKDLWGLMVDAQSTSTGIPSKLLEEKKKELAQRKNVAAGPSRSRDPTVDRYVREASQRAARARETIASNPGMNRNAPVPPPNVPVVIPAQVMQSRSVSPPHSEQQTPRMDESRSEHHKKRSSPERQPESDDESSGGSSSEDSRSIDSADDRRRRRHRDVDRRRRYDEDKDRRYSRHDRDHHDWRYHDRDYDRDRHRSRRNDDRDSFGRRRRSRSRSYERDRRRYRSDRRSRSYSSDSD